MKGYRTLLVNIALAIAPILQGTSVTDLGLTGKTAAIYAAVVTVINIGMRFMTTTPVGQSAPKQ